MTSLILLPCSACLLKLVCCNGPCVAADKQHGLSLAKIVYTDVQSAAHQKDFLSQGSVVKKQYYAIGLFVAAMWLVFLVDWILPITLQSLGLYPRSLSGILGIPLMPFLHANFDHLLGNTIPLIVLLFLLISSREDSWWVVGCIIVVSGTLLWVFGRSALHVGASGLTFGLCSFLITVGVRERRVIPVSIAILVVLIYGGTMLSGVIPRWRSDISWDGHLCGLIAGGSAGFWFSRPKLSRLEKRS